MPVEIAGGAPGRQLERRPLILEGKDIKVGDIKRILIVDDSEIDREVLRNMLNGEFEVAEAENGYSALDILLKKKEKFDAILLDVSMPLYDGISVLRILRENNLQDIQIFMITVEATKENIEKASQYNISDFIKKPFDRNEVLRRLRAKLGAEKKAKLTKADIDETRKYIADLEYIYGRYLSLTGQDNKKDVRRAYFMKVLLGKASERKMGTEKLDDFQIEMICHAAYLCNIGNMLLQNTSNQQHTAMGSYLLRLNYSKHCRQFVDICADICLRHHERFDGKGFTYGSRDSINSICAQICGLLERFEELFFDYSKHNGTQFEYVMNQLEKDSGLVSDRVFLLLMESKAEIVKYYSENISHKN